jgi:hypothetical protein
VAQEVQHDIVAHSGMNDSGLGGFTCTCGATKEGKHGYANSWAIAGLVHVPENDSFNVRSDNRKTT